MRFHVFINKAEGGQGEVNNNNKNFLSGTG